MDKNRFQRVKQEREGPMLVDNEGALLRSAIFTAMRDVCRSRVDSAIDKVISDSFIHRTETESNELILVV